MSFISVFRYVIYTLSLIFSLIVVALTAHLVYISERFAGLFLDFEAIAIVAAAISIHAIFIFIIVGAIRKSAFVTMIVVEFVTLVVIWVAWIVSSIRAAAWWTAIGCEFPNEDFTPTDITFCHELAAVEDVSFATWIIILIYLIVLIIYIIIGKSRGNKIWTVSVSEANFFGTSQVQAFIDLTQPNISGPQPLQVPKYNPHSAINPFPLYGQMPQQQYGGIPAQSVHPIGYNTAHMPQV